jgi:hypothetical protein
VALVLGWPAFVRAELEGAFAGLPVEQRRVIVSKMSDAGMSQRAIAPVVGVGNGTVSRDLAAASTAPNGADDDTDAPAPEPKVRTTTGLDGRERTTVTALGWPASTARTVHALAVLLLVRAWPLDSWEGAA